MNIVIYDKYEYSRAVSMLIQLLTEDMNKIINTGRIQLYTVDVDIDINYSYSYIESTWIQLYTVTYSRHGYIYKQQLQLYRVYMNTVIYSRREYRYISIKLGR